VFESIPYFSGLIFQSALAPKLSNMLLSKELQDIPTDIILQECLKGNYQDCSECRMMIPQTLLMRHIGHNTSTSGRVYDSNEFQCGWRHPFNGEINVDVW
jgi:hypothetical protein